MKEILQIKISRECAETALNALEHQLAFEQFKASTSASKCDALTKLIGALRVEPGLQTATEV